MNGLLVEDFAKKNKRLPRSLAERRIFCLGQVIYDE